MTDDREDTLRLMLKWANDQKQQADDKYHQEESGTFKQGIVLGRHHAMSDVIEFVRDELQEDNDE